MDSSKKLYFVPGFMQKFCSDKYKPLQTIAQNANYKLMPIHIDWQNGGINNYLIQLSEQVDDPKNSVLIGFSLGASVSLMSSQETFYSKLILCSPSPCFKEYLHLLPEDSIEEIGDVLYNDFEKISIDNLFDLKVKTSIMYGSFETICESVGKKLAKNLSNVNLIKVNGAGHDLLGKNYLASLENLLQKLS